MTGPLLESKYRVPPARVGDVARLRLSERLDETAHHALTLVSAPAGFGKTTVLASWLESVSGDRPPVAWVSLGAADNNPVSFWTYVVTALQRAMPDVGEAAAGLLQSQHPSSQAVVAALLNDLYSLDTDLLLVLDDYHLVDATEIQDGMAFLLEHQPAQLHLVIATRADPSFALAGLRAGGRLLEIRAADLRFTPSETAAYLNGRMGLDLTDSDIAALDGRTEGWIAALQLAAISMQGREDASAFIAGFAGDDRYVVDYLAEEVLARQSAEVRSFLLETSVLDRLSGPLCDAVTARPGGRATLVALERANLFLVPLDDRRRWWRYHHLFADVLHAHLVDELPDHLPELHRRASTWFEGNGETSEAVRHAMAAGDFDKAADLMEVAIPALSRERREAEFYGWAQSLPDEVVAVRPVLGIALAGALAQVSEFATVAARLDVVELSVRGSLTDPWPEQPPANLVVVDHAGYARLPGIIQMYRAALALTGGDLDRTFLHAQQALDLAPADDDLTRAGAGTLAGLAAWAGGDLDGALAAYRASMAGLQRAGFVADVLGCSIAVADILLTQGKVSAAQATYQHGLELAASQPGAPLRGTADMHVGLAAILLEHDDREGAAEHLAASQSLGDHNGLPQNPYRWRLTMARLLRADGDLDAALVLVDEAARVYAGDYTPSLRPVPAVRARLQVRRGEIGRAAEWAAESGVSAQDDLTYLREFEHATLVRLLLAQHAAAPHDDSTLRDAIGLLDRLLAAADAGGRGGTVIDCLVLLAVAHQRRGDTAVVMDTLQRAMTLAEAGGFVRMVAEEGDALMRLLTRLAPTNTSGFIRRVIAAIGTTGSSSSTGTRAPTTTPLVVPLSDRELDVLRLLGSDLSGPDIARHLSVSLNTVRTHTKSIYSKLGVNSRRAAVRQAAELNLTPGIR